MWLVLGKRANDASFTSKHELQVLVNPTEFLTNRRLLWAELHPTQSAYVEVLTHSTLKSDHIWK